jgi:hypothetical protein
MIHCLKCGQKTPNVRGSEHIVPMRSRLLSRHGGLPRKRVSAHCAVCHSKKSRILPGKHRTMIRQGGAIKPVLSALGRPENIQRGLHKAIELAEAHERTEPIRNLIGSLF